MGRFLYGLKREADYEIISMTGGQKDNAITREAVCDILVSKEEMDAVKAYASKVEKGLAKNITEVIRVFLSKSQKQAMNLQKSFTRQAVKKFCSI